MALCNVLDNFAEQIEQITCSDRTPGRDFHQVDLHDTDPDLPGAVRGFTVRFVGSRRAHEVEDMTTRFSEADVRVDVYYPAAVYPDTTRDRVITSDRGDLLNRLRDDAHWDATTIGLEDRDFDGDEVIDRSDTLTIYRQRWRCLVSETE